LNRLIVIRANAASAFFIDSSRCEGLTLPTLRVRALGLLVSLASSAVIPAVESPGAVALPIVGDLEFQPLSAQVRRVLEAPGRVHEGRAWYQLALRIDPLDAELQDSLYHLRERSP
jgi:hypothetical protein